MDSRKNSVTTATLCAPPPRIRPGAKGEPTEGRSRPVPVDFAPLSWSAQAIAAAERIGIGKAKPQAGRTRPKRQRLIATEGDSRQHDSDGDSGKATGDRRQPQRDSRQHDSRQHDSRNATAASTTAMATARQHDSTTAMATAARRQRDLATARPGAARRAVRRRQRDHQARWARRAGGINGLA